MLPGETLLLNCIACDKHGTRQTLQSGNSFGAVEWTDGRIVMPMMPREHIFRYWCCPACGTFQLIDNMERTDTREFLHNRFRPGPHADLWNSATELQEPGWRQYLNGIEQWEKRLSHDPDRETEIRLLAWRRYNDRFRHKLYRQNKEEHSIDAHHLPPDRWAVTTITVPRVPEMIENCNDAANWLYEGNPDKAMDKADLLRWLGRYELAEQLLKLITDLKEFDQAIHEARYTLLRSLFKNRNPRLAVLRSF